MSNIQFCATYTLIGAVNTNPVFVTVPVDNLSQAVQVGSRLSASCFHTSEAEVTPAGNGFVNIIAEKNRSKRYILSDKLMTREACLSYLEKNQHHNDASLTARWARHIGVCKKPGKIRDIGEIIRQVAKQSKETMFAGVSGAVVRIEQGDTVFDGAGRRIWPPAAIGPQPNSIAP